MTDYKASKRIVGTHAQRLEIEDVVYNTDTDEGVTINGNTATNNVSGSTWNHGYARSTQSISPSTGGGEVKFTMSRLYAMGGLDKSAVWTGSGNTFGTANYMMYHDEIYETGSGVKDYDTGTDDSRVFKITMDGYGVVKYFIDDVEVYESTVTASGTYYFLACPYDDGDFVTGEISAFDGKLQSGTIFEESDTGDHYLWNGTAWVQVA